MSAVLWADPLLPRVDVTGNLRQKACLSPSCFAGNMVGLMSCSWILSRILGVLLAADHRVWAPGPPCSCSATFLSIFRAATRNGSDRNVCYYSAVFAFHVYFPRSILGKNVDTCQPTTSSSQQLEVTGETQPFCKGKAETHCYCLTLFSFSFI